jgi:hypothetical protein
MYTYRSSFTRGMLHCIQNANCPCSFTISNKRHGDAGRNRRHSKLPKALCFPKITSFEICSIFLSRSSNNLCYKITTNNKSFTPPCTKQEVSQVSLRPVRRDVFPVTVVRPYSHERKNVLINTASSKCPAVLYIVRCSARNFCFLVRRSQRHPVRVLSH